MITEVETAAREAGIHLCGPLRWADRPAFTCFQASTETANVRRGAQAEIQQAVERFNSTGAGAVPVTQSGVAQLLAELTAQCGSITYEADCYASVQIAATTARAMSAGEQAQVSQRLREIIAANPNHAARIREIAARAGLALGGR